MASPPPALLVIYCHEHTLITHEIWRKLYPLIMTNIRRQPAKDLPCDRWILAPTLRKKAGREVNRAEDIAIGQPLACRDGRPLMLKPLDEAICVRRAVCTHSPQLEGTKQGRCQLRRIDLEDDMYKRSGGALLNDAHAIGRVKSRTELGLKAT